MLLGEQEPGVDSDRRRRLVIPAWFDADVLRAELASELASVLTSKVCCLRAELAAVLRCTAQVRAVGDVIVVEAQLPCVATGTRVASGLFKAFSVHASVDQTRSGVVLRVDDDGGRLVRQAGLVTASGAVVLGLPSSVVAGRPCDAAAAWRGAVLVAGTLGRGTRTPSGLLVPVPSMEVAMALIGLARRALGVEARTRVVREEVQVHVRDDDHVESLLAVMGATSTAQAWRVAVNAEPVAKVAASTVTNFDNANVRRVEAAAAQTAHRVARAFELLGDDVPEHVAMVGRLRIEHPDLALEALGRLCTPPLSKDSVAGRLRRLMSTADALAARTGRPDTLAGFSPSR